MASVTLSLILEKVRATDHHMRSGQLLACCLVLPGSHLDRGLPFHLPTDRLARQGLQVGDPLLSAERSWSTGVCRGPGAAPSNRQAARVAAAGGGSQLVPPRRPRSNPPSPSHFLEQVHGHKRPGQ